MRWFNTGDTTVSQQGSCRFVGSRLSFLAVHLLGGQAEECDRRHEQDKIVELAVLSLWRTSELV